MALRAELHAQRVDIRTLRDTGDERSHHWLMDRLASERPHDAVLSEEGTDDLERLDAERTWIIDPLDGTREFSEVPRTDWAVHVALVVDGEPVCGAVALPAIGVTLSTDDPPVLPSDLPSSPRLVVSRTRPPAEARHLAEVLDGQLVPMGSAGAKAMAVVRGEAEVYAHSGGQYEWDSCAPVAVAKASGLHTSRIDGSPLTYNHADPYLPDLLICRPELVDEVHLGLASLAGHG